MYTGIVKFFNGSKGYGFIIPDDANMQEIFFHCTKVQGKVVKDCAVQFEIEDSKKGLVAVNVKQL